METFSAFMPNALTIWAIRARHLLSFQYWLWRYRYFWSKVNIWHVNCAWATAFIFNTQGDILVKVSKFLRQKMYVYRYIYINELCLKEERLAGSTLTFPLFQNDKEDKLASPTQLFHVIDHSATLHSIIVWYKNIYIYGSYNWTHLTLTS